MTPPYLDYAIATLRGACPAPERWVPPPVFELIGALVPRPNVDLLIQDPARGTLLTWRDDRWHGTGWHVPGGMIRLKERAVDRVHACAHEELGVDVHCGAADAVTEIVMPELAERSHYIALLFRCTLAGTPDPARAWPGRGTPRAGQYAWHRAAPPDLLEIHRRHYAQWLNA